MITMKSIRRSLPERPSLSSPAFPFTTAVHRHVHSIVFAFTGLVFLCVDGCAVSECYESLRVAIGFVDHQLVFPYYKDEALNLLCQTYKKTDQCVALSIDGCSPSERIAVQGLDLAIRYLCHEGYEVYRQQRGCFLSPEVVHIAENCNTTYVTQLNDLRQGGKTIIQKKSLLCSHVDELVTCVRDGVTKKCGPEAGQLIFSLKTSIQKPVKEGMGCVGLTDSMNYEPPVVFIVIVCSLLSVAIVLITAIVHRRLKSSRSSNRSGSSSFPSSPDSCFGGRRLGILGNHFPRSGRLQLMESKTTDTGVSRTMKISSVESESSVTLQGASVMERESTTLSKPLLTVSETDVKK